MRDFVSILFLFIIFCSCVTTEQPKTTNEPASEIILQEFKQACKIRYKSELPYDHWQSAVETERLGTGDCEDFAIYLATNLQKRGLRPIIIVGQSNCGVSNVLHCWVECDGWVIDASSSFLAKKDSCRDTYKRIPMASQARVCPRLNLKMRMFKSLKFSF